VNLKNVQIAEGGDEFDYLAEYCFAGCTSLETIVIPGTITILEDNLFQGCKNLKSITIPKSVKKIKDEVFDGCSSLMDVYYTGTEEEWKAIENYEALKDVTIHYNYVPESPVSLGNLNGDNSIDATDAAFLLSAAAAAGAGGESGLTAEQTAAADLNGDGAFDASDAALILMYAAYSGAGGDLSITDYLAQL